MHAMRDACVVDGAQCQRIICSACGRAFTIIDGEGSASLADAWCSAALQTRAWIMFMVLVLT
jgi:hypothetical protein